jgi:hypothetical protein
MMILALDQKCADVKNLVPPSKVVPNCVKAELKQCVGSSMLSSYYGMDCE